MRKRIFGRQLGRSKNQRKALFRGLIASLLEEGEIETTLAKAKAMKPRAEKLVTKAKAGTLADKRVLFSFLGKRALVNRLVEEIAPLFKERKGGYLRIVRTGRRRGDQAPMARVLFTEKVEKMVPRPARRVSPPPATQKKVEAAKTAKAKAAKEGKK
ncbi:MAG TPA: 50S ribosomal protein L17 [Clostridia bacterium]|nr:50S ribosomal protein L17 [Clostridia bacterium]